MKKYFLKFIFIFTCLLPVTSLAATFSWSPASVSAGPGENFEVSLLINGDQEKINALSGVIAYNPDKLVLQEIREADSVINFWLEKPDLTTPGVVNFSGIIPGGFAAVLSPYYAQARPGRIFSLIFVSQHEGEMRVNLDSPQVFLNNPDGSLAKVEVVEPLVARIKSGAISNASVAIVSKDFDPPEIFIPQIGRDENIFAGQWFVAFSTRDTGSGVLRYEAQEHRNILPDNQNWQAASSPYLLTSQSLDKYISVRALDRAGNERVATLSPAPNSKRYANKNVWLIIIVLCIVSLSYFRYWFSSRRQS